MRLKIAFKFDILYLCRVGLALMLLTSSLSISAQNVLAGAQTGTIQAVREDDGFVSISGRDYNFDNEVTQVFLRGERVDSTLLDQGVVIRFTLNAQGVLERVEIIGPAARFANLPQN